MSDSEMSPASKTSDVHRLVMREFWCDPQCPNLHTGEGISGTCKLNGNALDFYDWYLADCVASCKYCDGTGDVHSLNGEYLGKCNCGAEQ